MRKKNSLHFKDPLGSFKKPWSGRFRERTKKAVESFTASIDFDKRLWKYDIEGSIAHAKMLGKQGIISQNDRDLIVKGLEEIKGEIEAKRFKFKEGMEDIHMNIESALIKKIGPAGGKLHTARSRNDQVTLDLRLFLRDEIWEIQEIIKRFQSTLVEMAEKYIDIVMPGYTHLQRAQPVLLSHHLLCYLEMLERDKNRFEECLKRVNVLPLGSGALAGTTLPIDREYVAELLNFPVVSNNSMDAVSDRDFVVEFLSASSILMTHLSRLSEELILWSTEEFGFIELPDAYSTGSSIMPQKKNPDIPELIRGKTGRVFGHLIAMLTTIKSLPLTYNRDLQEDKEPVFDTVDTVKSCLGILNEMLPEIKFNTSAMRKAAEGGFSTATDLAEYLVKKGLPFRNAHEITGKIVRYCLDKGRGLTGLSMSEFKKFSILIKDDVYSYLSVNASISNRSSYGGTSRKMILTRIKELKRHEVGSEK
ncbi:MAG TPA: argininosuccinate lyase [Nitrospiraceae bacterium]|nr:argininosuccinate lyase [Nitrospiraceae bacterium]